MKAMSRVAQQIQPLADLEANQAMVMGTMPAPVGCPSDQEASRNLQQEAEEVVRPARAGTWVSAQRKYAEDLMNETAQLWKRIFMRLVFFPFQQFCEKRLKIYPPAGKDVVRGELFYFEIQQAHDEEWQALVEASHYRYGCATWIPKDRPLSSETCVTIQLFPNARAKAMYERNGNRTIHVHEQDVSLLDQLNQEADRILSQHTPTLVDQ
jgi:hypothetical protein